MKKIILLCGMLMLSSQVFAENVTISDPDEVDLGNNKTECVYTNGDKTHSYVTTGECKYSKTFDMDEGE